MFYKYAIACLVLLIGNVIVAVVTDYSAIDTMLLNIGINLSAYGVYKLDNFTDGVE